MLHLDFSGCTSRAEILCARSLKVEVIGTPTNGNEKQACHPTFKVKLENVVKKEFLSVSSTTGAATFGKTQSWSTEQWDTVSFFGSDLPLTPIRRARISDGGIALCKHLQSCESDPDTPSPKSISSKVPHRVPSRSTFDVSLPTRDPKNPPKVTVEETHDAEIPANSPGSPVPSESDSSDDENLLFDTPQPKSHASHDLSTPLTPPSVYKPRGSFLGNESPSPAERKSGRPAPRRFPHLEHKSKIHSSGRSTCQEEDQNANITEDTLTESLAFDAAPLERKTAAGEEEEEKKEEEDDEEKEGRKGGDAAIETKLIDIKIEDDILEHETCSDAPSTTAVLKKASSSMKVIDVIRDIFGNEMLTLIVKKRKRCYGFKKKDLREEGPRCRRSVAKAKVEIAGRWLQEAQKPLPLPDLINKLYDIIELLFCCDHFSTATMKTASWVHSQGASIPAPKACDNSPRGNFELLRKDIEEPLKKDIEGAFTWDNNSSQSFSYKSIHVHGIDWYNLWQPQNTKDLGVKQSLAKWVVEPLPSKNGGKSGFLYVYSTSGDIESRKIGLTENPEIGVRLQAWRKCGDVNLVYPKEGEQKQAPFKHVYRLERLVHTELKNFRLKTSRCICNTNHDEWSHAPDALIVAVIRKWGAWLDLEPYEKCGEIWQLKDGFMNLQDICTPCFTPSIAIPSPLSAPELAKTSTLERLSAPSEVEELK
ncbi:hypothetical protein MMC32_007399 [Xylographa parallela]|nr:hypothetical protein [Xylographa parallela]